MYSKGTLDTRDSLFKAKPERTIKWSILVLRGDPWFGRTMPSGVIGERGVCAGQLFMVSAVS